MMTPAHPRLRGEHTGTATAGRYLSGSSPSTRGAPCCPSSSSASSRLIPVYAGSTLKVTLPVKLTPAHPRLRGEHFLPDETVDDIDGSSPSTRGARRRRPKRRRRGSAHPRLRGEHVLPRPVRLNLVGSSPSTRGALIPTFPLFLRGRLIPVYAGSTGPGSHWYRAGPAHPRLRGEHFFSTAWSSILSGSSPSTRGARIQALGYAFTQRLIPVYAGSTSPAKSKRPAESAHPRLRGEHSPGMGLGALSTGSSPSTRGAPSPPPRPIPPLRLIPVYAGST